MLHLSKDVFGASALSLAALFVLQSVCIAPLQGAGPREGARPAILPSPLCEVGTRVDPATAKSLRAYRASPVALDQLASQVEILIQDLRVADDLVLDLRLHRVTPVAPDAAMYVDGVSVIRRPDAGMSMWSGAALGSPSSYVYLALSASGCRGFFRLPERNIDLIAFPGASGWADPLCAFVDADALRPLSSESHFCAADLLNPSTGGAVSMATAPSSVPGAVGGPLAISAIVPIYECRIALETDYQFYQLFNDQNATAAYAMTLFGAVSDRYREQVGVLFTMPYFGMYTQNNDPWTVQDPPTTANCFDVFFEFQAKWTNGQAPVSADLYHLISGANLGCGVAWPDTLCDPANGFSVTGSATGGATFPVQPGSNTWDFLVMAHELGHNFGSPHTHEYCPPIDECSPVGVFGPCQTQQVCSTQGTIMSYCQECPGGMSNHTLFFHPTVVNKLRAGVLMSCLQPYAGIASKVDLGHALIGSNGAPNQQVTFQSAGQVLGFLVTSAPSSQAGLLFLSNTEVSLPLLSGTFVPSPDIQVPLFTNAVGGVAVSAAIQGLVSLPAGQDFYSQAWFADPLGPNVYAATNAVRFELIMP